MSRPDRWWRPTSRRPAVRARSRLYRYNQYDVNLAYDRGVLRGTKDTAERSQRRDDIIFRLAQAAEQGGEALENLAAELDAEEEARWWSGPIDDLAREVGVLAGDEDRALWDSVPPEPADEGESIVIEIEQWLRERDRRQD